MCHFIGHQLPALQVRRPEQNAALNARREWFITAKIFRNVLKQGNITHPVLRQHGVVTMRRRQGLAQGGGGWNLPLSLIYYKNFIIRGVYRAWVFTKRRRLRVEEYAYYVNKLRQNVDLKTWIWCQIVTSQTAFTIFEWPPYATEWTPPPMKIFCVSHWAQGWRIPLEIFWPLLEKCAGHSLKKLDPHRKLFAPPRCPKLVICLRQSSSQLQKYKAEHWNNGVKNTQRYDSAVHKGKNIEAARVSSNSSRAGKVCGWNGGHPGLTVWNLLSYRVSIKSGYMIKNTYFLKQKILFHSNVDK